MVDFATLRVLELGIGDVLDLDFSWLSVDEATIFAHNKPREFEGKGHDGKPGGEGNRGYADPTP